MKWQEVRDLFPNQFVLVTILNSHEEGDKEIVDEVVPVEPICDEDANKKFFCADPGNMVYHTANKRFIIHIRKDTSMKVRRMN